MIRNPQFERLTTAQQTQIKNLIVNDFKAAKALFDYFLQQQYNNKDNSQPTFQSPAMKD